jgi:proteic killer suppression protein
MWIKRREKVSEWFEYRQRGTASEKTGSELVREQYSLIRINCALTPIFGRTPPGNRLETKKGRLAGYYSIRINDQWRILFRWEGGNAKDVQITDYH